MRNLRQISFLTALALVFATSMIFMQSCRRHTQTTYGNNSPYDNSKMVIASINGIITDESGAIVENATVRLGSNTTQTDANGLFIFKNVSMPEHAATVHVSKVDYFNGSRTLTVQSGQMHQVSITLLTKGTPEKFLASSGGSVTFAGGVTYTFPANAIKNKLTGAAYSGQVFVYTKKIDPTTQLGMNSMPGDLRGLSAGTNEERLLQSMGMTVTELFAADGTELQIADASEVEMSMQVPASLASYAPASIPLWYFDEAKEMWVEEGYAILQGGKYVGKVKHFSFWNCDTPAAAVNIEMTIVDQNGNPLSGYVVKLKNTANNDQRSGTTNSSGWVGGLCYPNATLTLEVFASGNICTSTTAIYTQSVSTGAVNLNLGTITVNVTSSSSCTFDGTVVDCLGNPLSNSIVLLQPYNITVPTNSAGNFTYTLPCTPTSAVTFNAYDLSANVFGISTITLASGLNSLGNLAACGNVSPFLNITLTDVTTSISYSTSFIPPATINSGLDSTVGSATHVTAYGGSGGTNNYVFIQVADSLVGVNNITSTYMYLFGSGFTDTQFTLQPGSTVTYTTFPLFPGDAQGTFTINLIGVPSGDTYTATGSFRAPRTN